MNRNRMTPDEVDRIVAVLDETKRAEHWRDHDCRPDARFVKKTSRRDPKVVKAQGRIRTAHYRNRLDQRGSPTTNQIGMAMVVALVTSKPEELTEADRGLIGRMLVELQAHGFSIVEAKAMLRRLRNRLVDPADRKGEPSGSPCAALAPSS